MKCEHCGHDQAAGAGAFCDACGRKLTRVLLDDDADVNRPEEFGSPGQAKCRYCGHAQKQGRFCDACGMMFDAYRVEDEEELPSKRCPQCARHSTMRICPNCGIPIPGFPAGEEE
jgi:hypothetical protein